jgi:CheY-like chemotaxis protein
MSSDPTRILVVDDDRDSADTMADLLLLAGYDVRPVYGGQQAVEAVSGFAPRVAILDIEMPAMDGYAAARALRSWALEHGVQLVVIAHTAKTELRDDTNARRLGFDHVLAKPAEFKRLLQTIELSLASDVQGLRLSASAIRP